MKPLNIITEESLINEIRSTSKIIPLEIELYKFITIDKSWGNKLSLTNLFRQIIGEDININILFK
ncbi:MAG: hypothetical protein HUJ77_08950 [Clostridium sp.]|uniref:hypothetical protein n=1 Tax=Clostridium sp. TaxID=1506 RepID=UPI0025BFD5D2|nr:hypothetical protein [Clostridium sp.]MCF0148511.1 hypothetical protein [Clostridium sp.]